MAGIGAACGLRERKSGRLSQDIASADVFCTPGKCCALTEMLSNAATNVSVRRRPPRVGSLADRLFTAATTAVLSHRHLTFLPAQ